LRWCRGSGGSFGFFRFDETYDCFGEGVLVVFLVAEDRDWVSLVISGLTFSGILVSSIYTLNGGQ
jgi:hypothetical protein